MKIIVLRHHSYYHVEGAIADSVVPKEEVNLSEDVYMCDEPVQGPGSGPRSKFVRLISGLQDNDELGWHPSKGWTSVCPIDANYAMYRGIENSNLIKVDASNDGILDLLRER